MKISEIITQHYHDADLRQQEAHAHAHAAEAISPMELALIEMQEASGNAMLETLEYMGMVMSGRLKDLQQTHSTEQMEQRQKALLRMVQRMQEHNGGINAQLAPQNNSQHLGQQLLGVVAQILAEKSQSKKRRTLNDKLAELMAQEGWEISLFGLLELGHVDKGALAQINRLFQKAMDEDDVSLSEWFQRIMDWPDRRQRVKVLLRMMAFELSACVAGSQQQRLAAVLVRLRRLLLFLGLEQQCQRVESICQMEPGTLMPLLIDMTNESWLFDGWLAPRLAQRATSQRLYNRLLQHLDALFLQMPDACFNDEDQREQILTVLRGMKGDRVIT